MLSFHFNCRFTLRSVNNVKAILSAFALVIFFALHVRAQQNDPNAPLVVQPGAPGQPTRVLPSTTWATLPPLSTKDVEFMQGMIMHHAQAVEMVDLLDTRTDNRAIRLLGQRIRHSQSDEMMFMKRWLGARGKPVSMSMPDMGMQGHHHHALMPGMLTAKQMDALKEAKGAEFDRLFLTGMIQHHDGALIMAKDLFNTAGAGQDAELFNFATDVDSGQRAEIRVMDKMLKEIR